MLYSHTHRCIFAHVPKCAGTSIKRALDLDFVAAPYWHCSWADARTALGENALDSYFKFAVVRNPWDRIVSAWKMFEQKFWCKQERSHTLRSFLKVVVDESIGYRASYRNEQEEKQWMKTPGNIRHHTLPCVHPYYGLVDESSKVRMDLVIRYGALDAGFHTVCTRIGVNPTPLATTNQTEHEHYSRYYDAETRAMVAEYFADDIRAFGFRFNEH